MSNRNKKKQQKSQNDGSAKQPKSETKKMKLDESLIYNIPACIALLGEMLMNLVKNLFK